MMSPRRKERAANVSKNILPVLAAASPKPKNPVKLLAALAGFATLDEDDQKSFDRRPTKRRPHANKPEKYRTFVWKGRASHRTV